MSKIGSVRRIGLLFTFVSLLALTAFSQESTPNISWKEGVHIKNSSGTYKGKFGARVMLDIARFKHESSMEDRFGTASSGYQWRRLRVNHSGKFKNIKYKTSIEFSKEYVFIEDLFVEVSKVPVVGKVTVGHFKEPFLFEMHSSSKHVMFMERGVTTLYSTGRNVGVMVSNKIGKSDFEYEIGVFSNGAFDVVGGMTHIGYNFIGRVAGILTHNEDRSNFLHIGGGIKQSTLDYSSFKMSARPATNLGPKYISSGTLEDITGLTAAQTEVVVQIGSFSFQSEMVHGFAYLEGESRSKSAYYFPTMYAQVSYLLTGESRNYKGPSTGFKKIKPTRNLFEGGFGAVEVALRYSYANMNSHDVQGGIMNNTTVGLNWYPNRLTRMSANYISANLAGVGRTNIWQMRFQVAI